MSRAPDEGVPGWIRALVIGGAAIALGVLEMRRRLRPARREPKAIHTARNLTLAGAAGVVLSTIEDPLSRMAARCVHRSGLGLAPLLTRSPALQTLAGVLMLDYGLYLWHVLTHRVPFLWRFHLPHHIDLDMDASTGIRFHFGEMLLSVPWRILTVRLSGASPLALSIWQTALFCSILFHHSNVRLPLWLERRLSRLVMTPRLHDIHHRAELSSTNANWSSGLAFWDLLHGTWKWTPSEAPVGVPAYQDVPDAALSNVLTLPFRRSPDLWGDERALPKEPKTL